ncbi:hypothetical protein DLD77_09165 [Chitinophaga alhagiae]|uniref:DUF5343 domain-containing protein n=1 Tax=Chitinophaga alhagiae TaxID=2203219 RepID=A0ABM6WD73_9BACT|nr:DUF5343 domain-containing protein [Chitinophaga alhagiae]AWO01854.1 hypothetical protein DLD77_09165 [Chitinophaga alhagiae]
MAADIPYLNAPGSIGKILEKIKEASTPETFSQDFLKTKLGFNGGNYLTFIPWAKKAGLVNSDGTPTSLYKQFRNPTTSAKSLGTAMRQAYRELFSRNEYCNELDRKAFKGLVMEATGEAHDSKKVENIVSTFFNAKALADFDSKQVTMTSEGIKELKTTKKDEPVLQPPISSGSNKQRTIGLNYTINLVLPKTDDPAIFNAIFKSLKENLLNE